MGALVDEGQVRTVMRYIDAGRSEGAQALTGGERLHPVTGGCYVEPTVFDRVSNEMTIAREEIFGPVLSVIRFRTEDEAIALANDSPYGLQASVWTRRPVARAPRRARPARRHRAREPVRRGRHHGAVRRLQAERQRPRQVAARAGQVHGVEDHLDPALGRRWPAAPWMADPPVPGPDLRGNATAAGERASGGGAYPGARKGHAHRCRRRE